MKKINIIAIAVAILSLVFIMVGCGGSNTNTNPIPASPTVVQSPQNSPDSTSIKESLGGLKEGMSESEVIALLGQPETKTEEQYEGATGEYIQFLGYISKGISLKMGASAANSSKSAISVTIEAPCTYKTTKNIGIGSTKDEVNVAYKNDITQEGTNEHTIVVKSMFGGGVIFGFDNNKVSEISLGAIAE